MLSESASEDRLCSVSREARPQHWGAMQRKEPPWAEERALDNRMGLDSSSSGVVTFSVTFIS